jgi:hypothetical protein
MMFCNNLCQDDQGLFCAIKAIEGRGCNCSFTEGDCRVVKSEIQCSNERTCEDFEPSTELQQELL